MARPEKRGIQNSTIVELTNFSAVGNFTDFKKENLRIWSFEFQKTQQWNYGVALRKIRWEAAKKSYFLSGPATKRGGGKGCATKVKRTFFIYFSPKIVEKFFLSKSVSGYLKTKKKEKSSYVHQAEGGGGRATKKEPYFAALPIGSSSINVTNYIQTVVGHLFR